MTNDTAWTEFEASKTEPPYEQPPPDEFYCKLCKQTFEYGDSLIEIYQSFTDSRSGTYVSVGLCDRCYL